MIFLILFISLIILILFIPLFFKVNFVFDVLLNSGFLKIKLWSITIIKFKVKYKKMGFLLFNNKKARYIPLVTEKNNTKTDVNIFKVLFKTLTIDRLNVLLVFGYKQNAFFTAMVTGFLKVLTNSLISLIITEKQTNNIKSNIYPNYQHNVIDLDVNLSFGITLLEFAVRFIKYYLKEKEYERVKKSSH